MKLSFNYISLHTLRIAVVSMLFVIGGAVAHAAGTVTLTFDDGNPSQYQTPAQLLKAAGQTATFYINSGLVGQSDWYMTWNQVKNLHTTGFEVAAHGLMHIELPTVPLSTIRSELNQDYSNFVAKGITPTDFATPFGAYDNIVLSAIAKKYNSHRAFANQGLNFWPYNKYLLYVRYVTNQTSLEQAKVWVDEAVAQDGWLVLVFHEILPAVDPTDDYSWETATFQSFIDYLDAKNIRTKTVAKVLMQSVNLIANPSFEEELAGWITDNTNSMKLNTANNGSYPTPKNTVKVVGTAKGGHLFGKKVSVSHGVTYGLRVYTDSQNLTSGEVGFYIDEYDESGAWVSGKWQGALYNQNVIDRSYVYQPTSVLVKTAAVQVYATPGTKGSVFIDNVELFARNGESAGLNYNSASYVNRE
ncbi:polysaccharide deacetylase family protein [Patescibacteria group bacterium]|nr:polysaccharide deacetylase family protein [Patescibacteria group bacterium]